MEQLRFCGFFGGFTLRHLFKKSIRCANILAELAEKKSCPRFAYTSRHRSLIKLEWAEREIVSFHKSDLFNVQITLDGHNPRLKFNYCLLFGPPLISLLSTFKQKTYVRLFLFYLCLNLLLHISGVGHRLNLWPEDCYKSPLAYIITQYFIQNYNSLSIQLDVIKTFMLSKLITGRG